MKIQKHFYILTLVILMASVLTLCKNSSKDDYSSRNDSSNPEITFEEFLTTVAKEPGPNGVYIVDGDIPLSNEKKLRDYYDEYVSNNSFNANIRKSIVYYENGLDVIWNETQGKNLTYCISKPFVYPNSGTDHYNKVKTAIYSATQTWENATNSIKFIHTVSQDSNCNGSNNSILFSVEPISSGSGYTFARAFFPNYSRIYRKINITEKLAL